MGYKICTSGVQNFLGYEMAKRGIVPQNAAQFAAENVKVNAVSTALLVDAPMRSRKYNRFNIYTLLLNILVYIINCW